MYEKPMAAPSSDKSDTNIPKVRSRQLPINMTELCGWVLAGYTRLMTRNIGLLGPILVRPGGRWSVASGYGANDCATEPNVGMTHCKGVDVWKPPSRVLWAVKELGRSLN